MASSLLLLLFVLAVSAAAQSGVTVGPTRLDTNSSENVYYTVINAGQAPLFNVSVTLPGALRPVGFIAESGRWYASAKATPEGGYSVSWYGGPIEPGQTVTFGIAMLTPSKPASFTSSVILANATDQTVTSTITLAVGCPCFLGIDLRYLAYWLVGGVLVLPVAELAIHPPRRHGPTEVQPPGVRRSKPNPTEAS